MISVPNLRQQLNGSKWLLLILLVTSLSACDLFKPVQSQTPTKPKDRELDDIQGSKVYNPQTGEYETIDRPSAETMDTIIWKDIPINREQIITSSTEAFIGNTGLEQPDVLDVDPDTKSQFLSAYNVSLVLPFLTDKFQSTGAGLPPNSTWALNFYGGAKMALEDLEADNVKMNIAVVDNKASEPATTQLLRSNPDLANAHLIIGPYRRETTRLVAAFAKEKDKVLVSPYTTAADAASNNPNYIQVNPTLQSHCSAIMRHARQRYRPDQVVLLCRDKPEEIERLKYFQDENLLISGFANAPKLREYIVAESSLDFNNSDVLSLIRLQDTTVFVVPSWSSETFIYSLLRKLDLSKRASNHIVVYGMPQWIEYETIEYDYYERLNLHVSSSSFIDPLSPDIQFFKRRFFDRYGIVPNQEAYLGYDVTLFFGKMLKEYGTKFQYSLEKKPTQVLHTRFEFERVVVPSATVENPPPIRWENKYVNILAFRDYQFRLAD